MAFSIFAYVISCIVIMNPYAAAAVQSDTYAEIFSASDPEQFKQALNNYFSQYLSGQPNVTAYQIHEEGTQKNEESLLNSFSIEHQFSGLVNTKELEFLVFLGSSSPSVTSPSRFEII